MRINEKFKKFWIKFYKNTQDNTILYDTGFTQGTVSSMEEAFKLFSRETFILDLINYYDDVVNVRLGKYIPSINNKIKNNKQYIGKIELFLDLEPYGNEQTRVSYLMKHKEEIPKQSEYIENRKKKEKIQKFRKKLKSLFFGEMFLPQKTREELICEHCRQIIKTGNYYEEYRDKNYHIECIWDKIINKQPENSYKEARNYFLSLQKYVGDWPAYGLDVEEDYVSDLELVKHNDRMNEDNIKLPKIYNNLQNFWRIYEGI